jgi:hypothetical protein
MPDFDDDETTLISDRDKGLISADTELEYASVLMALSTLQPMYR